MTSPLCKEEPGPKGMMPNTIMHKKDVQVAHLGSSFEVLLPVSRTLVPVTLYTALPRTVATCMSNAPESVITPIHSTTFICLVFARQLY